MIYNLIHKTSSFLVSGIFTFFRLSLTSLSLRVQLTILTLGDNTVNAKQDTGN